MPLEAYSLHSELRRILACVNRVLAYIVAPEDDGGSRVCLNGTLKVYIVTLLDVVSVK